MEQGPQRRWDEWLKDVEAVERAHPNQRIVSVSFPGGVPAIAWNVENNLYRGHSPLDGNNFPHMRAGIYGSFMVLDGPFEVRFNDGEVVQ